MTKKTEIQSRGHGDSIFFGMTNMQYRPMGKTGLQVSVLSFGAATLGNEYGDISTKEATRAVHYAIAHGINYFDTSPYYGRTLSEVRLGKALQGYRDRVIIATKGGRYDKTLPDGFDFSAERLHHSVDESLKRLQTDVIDVYQLHDIEFEKREVINNEALPELVKLRERGKIRFIGITGYPLKLLQAVAEAHAVDMILSYCHYNLMNTTLEKNLLPFAQSRGIGVVNASPLHMGLLTEQRPPPWFGAPQDIKQAAQEAAKTAQAYGQSITQLALQFALQNEAISTTLVGMKSVSEVQHNLAALNKSHSPEALRAVQAVIAPVKDYNWHTGLPENQDDYTG